MQRMIVEIWPGPCLVSLSVWLIFQILPIASPGNTPLNSSVAFGSVFSFYANCQGPIVCGCWLGWIFGEVKTIQTRNRMIIPGKMIHFDEHILQMGDSTTTWESPGASGMPSCGKCYGLVRQRAPVMPGSPRCWKRCKSWWVGCLWLAGDDFAEMDMLFVGNLLSFPHFMPRFVGSKQESSGRKFNLVSGHHLPRSVWPGWPASHPLSAVRMTADWSSSWGGETREMWAREVKMFCLPEFVASMILSRIQTATESFGKL